MKTLSFLFVFVIFVGCHCSRKMSSGEPIISGGTIYGVEIQEMIPGTLGAEKYYQFKVPCVQKLHSARIYYRNYKGSIVQATDSDGICQTPLVNSKIELPGKIMESVNAGHIAIEYVEKSGMKYEVIKNFKILEPLHLP